jgi:hypothetical protein
VQQNACLRAMMLWYFWVLWLDGEAVRIKAAAHIG